MKKDTKVVVKGRKTKADIETVNPPVQHASTVLLPGAWALKTHDSPFDYARRGTPSTHAFQEALADLEGAHDCVLTSSGLAAVSTTILSMVKSGDHILVTDSCYAPTRRFCEITLKKLGVETTFYDPAIAEGIADLFQPNTRLVFCESPGSQTFEVQNIPAIAKIAHARNAYVVADNTWASSYYCKPLELGADISLQSLTKYVGGHSDLLLGAICATKEVWAPIAQTYRLMGCSVGPDDVYLAQRGLRTLAVRMARHFESGVRIAQWLSERPEVDKVMHPALPDHPQHARWKRDFSGASGTFGVILHHGPDEAIDAMIDSYEHFGIGYSFGGFESLAITVNPSKHRTATQWDTTKTGLRYHIGLEDPDDLIKDLEAGFERLTKETS